MPRVAVNIVTWNSLKYLPEALTSIANQSFRDFRLLVIDNASADGTADFVRRNFPEAGLLRNFKNLGFSRAHNQGITYARTHLSAEHGEPLVLVTNPDVVLEPDFLEKLVAALDRRPEAGSVGGKICRLRGEGSGEARQSVRTDIIDSTGLRLSRSGRVADRGAGETDGGEVFVREEEVFGLSGAVALYRLTALDDVAYRGECFDEDFFAYKEDVDLAWRLRLRGWKSFFIPTARAYHHRAAGGGEKAGLGATVAGRRGRSKFVSFLSYRNHLLLLAKNEQGANFLRYWPFIVWYEFRKFIYLLFFEPAALRGLFSFFRLLPRALAKRKLAMSRARTSAKEMRRWFK